MRKTLFTLMAVGAIAFGGSMVARAQADPAIFKVPFPFVVGGKLLPAGSYRVDEASADTMLLQITSLDGKAVAAFMTAASADSHSGDQVDVSFKSYQGEHFLWKVAVPGQDARVVALSGPQMDRLLAKLNLLPAARGDVAK